MLRLKKSDDEEIISVWRTAVKVGGDVPMSERGHWFTKIIMRDLQRCELGLRAIIVMVVTGTNV